MGDILASHPLAEFFADNKLVIAACNIAALFGIFWALYKLALASWRFVREAWRTSVRKAIRRQRRAKAREVKLCTIDLHYYLSRIVRQLVLILIAAVGTLLISMQPMQPIPPTSFRSSLTDGLRDIRVILLLSNLGALAMFLVFALESMSLVKLGRLVLRRRKRMLKPGGVI